MRNNIDIKGVKLLYGDTRLKIYKIKFKQKNEDSNLNISMHDHKYYEIHFAFSGEIVFSNIDNKFIVVPEGHFLIIPPGTIHSAVEPGKYSKDCVLEFLIEKIEKNKNFYNFFSYIFNNAATTPIKASRRLQELINIFVDIDFDDTITQYVRLTAITSEIVNILCETLNTSNISGKIVNNDIDIATKIDVLINDFDYTLSDIAHTIGYSERHTARLILELYSMPLSEIRHRRMIVEVKELLMQDIPIEQIVTKCKFTNASQMRNIFYKYENMSPSEYRKMIKGN